MGLASHNELIRNRFIDFLNSDKKLPSTEEDRIKFIMRDLYNSEYEDHWLTISSNLLLSLSRGSEKYNQKIIDKPLSGYVSKGFLRIGENSNKMTNTNTPLIPFSLMYGNTQGSYRERLVKATQYSISGDDFPNRNRLPTQSDPRQKELMMKIRHKYAPDYTQGTSQDPDDLELLMSPDVMTYSKSLDNKGVGLVSEGKMGFSAENEVFMSKVKSG